MSISEPKRRPHRVVATFAAAAVLSTASLASGSPAFPSTLRDTFDLPCAPPCTICHDSLQGGFGTIATEFGRNMQLADLIPGRSDSVEQAVLKLQDPVANGFVDGDGTPLCVVPAVGSTVTSSGECDSDGDSVGDLTELMMGTDPGEADSGNICGDGPTFGCGARIEPRSDLDQSGAIFAILAALGLLITRRR